MIEARTSRVRLPKGSGAGEGERGIRRGFALPPEGAGAGPRDKILRTVTPLGVERCRGFIRFVCTEEVMTTCHDFIFI